MTAHILLLAGDGIGPEIMQEAKKILQACINHGLEATFTEAALGGAAYEQFGKPLPETTLNQARQASAILLGAVGGPQWDQLTDRQLRPEQGLLQLRQRLDLFANLRPALMFPQLINASSLKPSLVENLDLMIVRELTSGIYFGQPRQQGIENNQRVAINTMRYNENEISRIGKIAFTLARQRQKKLCSVDKANVLETSQLWRAVINELAQDYPDVALTHMYVDNAAMQLVRAPKQFDVIVTENMFGDILSDQAAMLTGSIGMLPSASLNSQRQGLYEPCHGSAPDITGQNKANPLAIILSLALLLRLSLQQEFWANAIETAVTQVLAAGFRTADIAENSVIVTTKAMGDAVLAALQTVLAQQSTLTPF